MSVRVPAPKLPHVTLPTIRNLPTIPNVGCAGGDGTTYIGKQFGGLPDIATVLHIKALKKAMEEQIYALVQGELPVITRAPIYAARAAQLVEYVESLLNTLTATINNVTEEVEGSIDFANSKIAEINSAKNEILSLPESARSAAQRSLLSLYDEYIAEGNAQINRLESSIACIAA